jgi:hypothetical protein
VLMIPSMLPAFTPAPNIFPSKPPKPSSIAARRISADMIGAEGFFCPRGGLWVPDGDEVLAPRRSCIINSKLADVVEARDKRIDLCSSFSAVRDCFVVPKLFLWGKIEEQKKNSHSLEKSSISLRKDKIASS